MIARQRCPELASAEVHGLSRGERAGLLSIRSLINTEAGLLIGDGRLSSLLRRVTSRMIDLGISSIDDYCRILFGDDAEQAELQALIDRMTTNKTSFFREHHHFQHLVDVAVPRIAQRLAGDCRSRVRMWSAGCADLPPFFGPPVI